MKNKGITLIALVITIIVLLILTGVSINMISGENGIITKAKLAAEETRYASIEEAYDLWQVNNETLPTITIREFIDKIYDEGNITDKEYQEIQETGKVTIAEKEIIFWINVNNFELSKNTLSIVKDGIGSLTLTSEPVLESSDVIWESSNSSVAKVNNGELSALSTGTTTITCKLKEDESIKAECLVNVVDGSLITLESVAGEVLETHLLAKNFPTDCTIEFKFATNVSFDPSDTTMMQNLRDARTYTVETDSDMIELIDDYYQIDTGFYWDYFYRLKDSFGNYSDYFWVSPNFLCFTENTKIQTPNGNVNIQNIKTGDKVYSMNLETFTIEEKLVLRTFENEVENNLCKVYTSDTDYIECTFGHEIYTTNKGWTKAYYLETGDKLLDSDNNEITVIKNEKSKNSGTVTVYNFEVDGNHNYFVGNHNVLVHNPPEPDSCVLEDGYVYTSTNIGK